MSSNSGAGEGEEVGSPVEDGWSGRARRWAWVLIAAGIVLRVGRYVADRSLWCDEAMLSLNIAERSYAGLLRPLDRSQGAPIGFLLLEKAAWNALGPGELALRLLPLAAGIISLPLFYLLARRCLCVRGTLLALSLFASSEALISYSAEVKQYSCDVAIGLTILLGGIAVLERVTTRRLLAFGLLGVVAPWFSHAATFMLAGVGSILLLRYATSRQMSQVLALCSVIACWALSFAFNYAFFLKPLAQNQSLLNYWVQDFAPFPPRSLSHVSWYVELPFRTVKEIYGNPPMMRRLGEVLSGLAAVSLAIGLIVMIRKDRWITLLILSPIAFTLAASILHKYPMRGRLVLFLQPICAILIGAGAASLWGARNPERRAFAWVATLLLFAAPWLLALSSLVRSPGLQETKPLLSAIKGKFMPDDVVYLGRGVEPAALYYSRYSSRYSLPEGAMIPGGEDHAAVLRRDLAKLKGRERVWVILVHFLGPDDAEEEPICLLLDSLGTRLEEGHAIGASYYLYNLKPKSGGH